MAEAAGGSAAPMSSSSPYKGSDTSSGSGSASYSSDYYPSQQPSGGGSRHQRQSSAGGGDTTTATAAPTAAAAAAATTAQRAASTLKVFASEESRRVFGDSTPNILFCGLPRSGKSSISRVVFFKTSPHETLYSQPTKAPEVHKIANTRLVKFTLIDVPGALLLDSQFDSVIFSGVSALVFVIDAQSDPYTAEIAHCKSVFKRAWQINPRINLEVFIHKIDGDVFTVDEVRTDCQRDIHDKLMSHLHEEGVAANVVFYSTSIYDHTIFEACSRVVQRLIPQTPTLEQLLDLLVANCRMEKAFLIDVLSKTFIATDTSPFDPFSYELCTDMVEVIIEVSCIYGQPSAAGEVDSDGAAAAQRNTTDGSGAAAAAAWDPDASATTSGLIHLTNEYALYLKEVDRLVALACVLRAENFEKQNLVDHNIRVFRDAMRALFADPSQQSHPLPTAATSAAGGTGTTGSSTAVP